MRPKQRGFTMAELLIVIVIVAILTSMSVVRYINLRDKSRVAAATYDLDLVRKLLAYYATDYSRYPGAATTYNELQDQLIDPTGQIYGKCPISHTFDWFSYSLDSDSNYVMRVRVQDRNQTILVATPDRIYPE